MSDFSSRKTESTDFLQAIEIVGLPEERLGGEGPAEQFEGVFDKEVFLHRMLGDLELGKQVVGLFLSCSAELMSAIRAAVARKDPEALLNAVHSLKGSVANFEAKGVIAILLELEEIARTKQMAQADKKCMLLEKEVHFLREALSSIVGPAAATQILIADDDAISRKMLQATLMKWGYDPVVCANGAQALSSLDRPDGPKLAILDWMMPEMDGVQVCSRLAKRRREDYIYILLLTSKHRSEEIIEGLDTGADDYIVKPFDPHELRLRLREGFRKLDVAADLISDKEEHPFEITRDPVTGLLGSEAVLVALKREISGSRRKNTPLGVMIVEPDRLKGLSQQYGPTTGDAILGELAARVSSVVRPQDHIGRYQNSQFLVVVPGYGKEVALALAEQIRLKVISKLVDAEQRRFPITVCIGATSATGSKLTNLGAVISAAEKALIEAKGHGPGEVAFEQVAFQPHSGISMEPKRPAPSQLDRKLMVTIRSGNLNQVRGLLDTGAHVNTMDKGGNTPLIEAAFFNYPELVRVLLEKGADPGARNDSGDTALTEAIRAGHREVVEVLLPRLTRSALKETSSALYKALVEASTYGKTGVTNLVKQYLSSRGYIRAKTAL